MKIDNMKISLNSIIATLIYWLFAMLSYGVDNILATTILSLSFFWIWNFVVGWEFEFFSIYNYFVGLIFVIGIYLRYLVVGCGLDKLVQNAYIPPLDLPEYHTITALFILISVICLSVGKCLCNHSINANISNKMTFGFNNNVHQLKRLKFIAIVLVVIVYYYRLSNMWLAVFDEFGTYDNLINMIYMYCKFVAYISLIEFFKYKKKSALLLAIFILLPEAIIATISAWKGPLILLLLSILILYNSVKKVSKKIIFCGVISFFIGVSLLYPMVSMYRDNLYLKNDSYTLNMQSISDFYDSHNLFQYLSGRFNIYDINYYVLNLESSKIETYLNVVGLDHERFVDAIVPRFINPEKKSVSIGVPITHYIYGFPSNVYNNLPLFYICDAWINYGILGSVIMSLFLGYAFCKLEYMKRQNIFNLGKYLIYGDFLLQIVRIDVVSASVTFIGFYILLNCVLKILGVKNNG